MWSHQGSPSSSTVTYKPAQANTVELIKDSHGSQNEKPVPVTESGRVLTKQEALRLYSLSAAELELHGAVDRRKKGKSQGKDRVEVYRKHLASEYEGGMVRKWFYKYFKPTREFDQEDIATYTGDLGKEAEDGKRPFMNPVGEVVWKYEDVDTYLSPLYCVPKRLIVQATDATRKDQPASSWRRTEIKGTVSLALRMTEWSLSPELSLVSSFFSQALVAIPLQILLALPRANAPWEMTDFEASYLTYPAYHWKWP